MTLEVCVEMNKQEGNWRVLFSFADNVNANYKYNTQKSNKLPFKETEHY